MNIEIYIYFNFVRPRLHYLFHLFFFNVFLLRCDYHPEVNLGCIRHTFRILVCYSEKHIDSMAEWDLTSRMGQYLDRHLVFPLLEFLSVKEVRIHKS